jgi:prolipoprotein diacylglyceryl transferase
VDAALTPLAAIPSPTQGVWNLGPIPIRAYALCIVLGIIVACLVTDRRLRARGAPPYSILDVAVWAVPCGIIGARIYHVITTPSLYFGAGGNFFDAFRIWQGGLGIWGGVVGGALGGWYAARRIGLPITMVLDAAAVGLPLAQAIGRWGNYFNNELYGGETNLPWGLKIYNWDAGAGRALVESGTGEPIVKGIYHPTFLYECLWCIGVALFVWLMDRKFKFGRGRAFALYVMAYTVGRFWIEAMRTDEAVHIFGMRLNDWVSILVFLGAALYFFMVKGPQETITPTATDPSTVDAAASDDEAATATSAEKSSETGKLDDEEEEEARPASSS